MPWCKAYLVPVLVSLLAIVLLPQFDLAALQRAAVLEGQWWRLFSGHLVHTNLNHLLMNLLGLWLIVLIYPSSHSLRRQLLSWLSLLLLVALFLLLLTPTVQWYVGLSGVLHGLLVLGAGDALRRGERWQSIVLVGVLIKVGWELWKGASTTTAALIDAPVLVEAHLAGVVAGLLVWLLPLIPGAAKRG